jgi:hypothetical protein
MKAAVWLLSGSLLTVTVATSAWSIPSEAAVAGAKAAAVAERVSPLRLAGAGGHDSVGGLMPLPLWPSRAVHAQELGPAKSGQRRSRKCSNLPCPRIHN